MKRILLATYLEAYLYHGGGEREIFLLKDVLNQSGFLADLYGPQSQPIEAYQTVIHFSLNASEVLLDHLQNKIPQLILWPNTWFVTPPSQDDINILQNKIYRFQTIVFRSKSEEIHFRKYFKIDGLRVIHIQPGISPEFFNPTVTSLFTDVYGIKDYIFWPGIIEPQKNQLAAVKALSGLDVPVVISGSVRDQAYYQQCRAEAGKNIHFLPEMPFASEIHLSALANCKTFLELPLDFPGLSALEGGLIGCQMVLSQGEWTQEFFKNRTVTVDPTSCEQIREAVCNSMYSEHDKYSHKSEYQKYILPKPFNSLINYLGT